MKFSRIIGLCLLGASILPAQTVNCLVAVVNGRAITLIDVQVVADFGLAPPSPEEIGKDPRFAALDALIDRAVVLDMTRDARSVDRGETTAALERIREELGESEFTRLLRVFGLHEKDLRPYVEERLLFERALALRFSRSLPVSQTEVERHYRDVYAPEQARLGMAPEPLSRVQSLLEARIREEALKRQTEGWIKDLRARSDIRINKDCLK